MGGGKLGPEMGRAFCSFDPPLRNDRPGLHRRNVGARCGKVGGYPVDALWMEST